MGSRFRLAAFLSGLAVVAVALVLMLQLRSKDEKKVEGKQPAGTVETKQPPSDEKAFYSTYGFTDPVERLEALENFFGISPAHKPPGHEVRFSIITDGRTTEIGSDSAQR